MNLTRAIRFLLLLLFALLQCVAPLAHAHVNNEHASHAGQGVHLAMIDTPGVAAHASDTAHFAAEHHSSAVVCMPPEYRCGDLTAAQPLHANRQCPSVPCEHIALRFVNLYQQPLPLPPYQHPRSQAPPA